MNWMLLPLKRYADFSGRSRRKEYWMFVLGYVVLAIVGGILVAMLGGMANASGAGTGSFSPIHLLVLVAIILGLALVVPTIAVQVRRFHDQDRSGWFVLLGFVPYIGGIVVLVFMCLPGTVGPNRFGLDPKDENLSDVFA